MRGHFNHEEREEHEEEEGLQDGSNYLLENDFVIFVCFVVSLPG